MSTTETIAALTKIKQEDGHESIGKLCDVLIEFFSSQAAPSERAAFADGPTITEPK